ncbi:3243_t:CDS:2 [Gigaspora rosea]|nr:3243_t:CDS:2 [Gigaspora rosea]
MSYNQNPDPYIELATQIASLVQQLQVPQTLQANWFQKLTQRKQLIGENVDEYYVEKANLIRRLEIGGYCFPEVTKVQVFVNGLCSEFSMSLSPLHLKTLEEAHTRAKACL